MNTHKTVKIYGFTTLFCIAFNYIYSLFGHGVSSPFMSYAFAFSLVLGVGGFIALGRLNVENRIAFNLYNAGIATLTVGSLLRGIIDIAGADTIYPVYYFVVGTVLVAVGGLMYFYQWQTELAHT
ncbi:MAG: hypothetical protein H6662_16900 [Ardenticatenaceae bacterium]|nr:hypothetical protein [Anaerolineales bacterium]MCB8923269.1 hypothetical protein [Ardenticatenaceae bacterium]